jgi:hypothetical protein
MAKLGDLVVRVGANTRLLNQGLKQAKADIRRTTGEIQNMGRTLSMSISAPLALIGASSVKVFADFEQSMAKVKAVSGATASEFEGLTNNAKELGRTTRFTASEVSALQLEYAKLGFSADEITQVTGATLNLAQATGSDLAQSAEVAGATLRAFGLDASQTGHVTDVMAAAFSSSALDINSFQDAMKYVAPVAKAAGVTLEEATAMLGQLANNGIKGSQAGTSLRRILQDVAGTGMDFKTAMGQSAEQVINLADAKDEVGRSASSAFLVLKEGIGDVDGLTKALQESDGAAKGMADTMDDTAEGAFKKMMSAIEGAQIEIGSKLAPGMIKLAGVVGDTAGAFSNMSEGAQMAVIALGGVASGVGPMLTALPNFAKGLKMAKLAFASLNKTMLANPFGAVAAAIGLVVGAVIMLNNASSEGSDKVDQLKKSLGGMDLEQQKQAIEGARTAQEAYVEQIKEQKAALEALPKYKRSEQSQAGRDLKKLAETLETANAELAAMQQLEEGVALKLKQKADEANNASVSVTNLGNSTEETTEKLKDKSKTLGFLMNKLEEVPDTDIWKPVRDSTDKTNQSLGFLFNMLAEVPSVLSPGQIAAQELADEMAAKFTELAGKVEQVGGTIGNAFANVVNQGIEIKRALEEGLITPLEAMEQKAENAKKAVRGLVKDAILALINMAKMNVIANATSPANAANLASGGLAAPAFIVAGLSMLEGFVGGLTAFADGGIVSGPTMGLVGEYPGASTNPEVIAPLDKLRGMLGGQAVQVTGKISGRDILLTSERNAIDRNRVRGF